MNDKMVKRFVVKRAVKGTRYDAQVADLERFLYKITVAANHAARTGETFEWSKFSRALTRVHSKVEGFTGLTNRYRDPDNYNQKADRLFRSALREADNLIAFISQLPAGIQNRPGYDLKRIIGELNKSADIIRKKVRAGVALLD